MAPRKAPVPDENVASLPTAVTFDCWNTLLCEEHWPEAHALRVGVLREAACEAGAPVEMEAAAGAFDRAWARHMDLWAEGVATGAAQIARWALTDLGIAVTEPERECLVAHFEEASHTSRVVALDGAVETLARLTGAGVPMALICDTGLTPGRVVRQHLDRLGLLAPLQAQLFSDEVGIPKPDERIFRSALAALGVAARGAIHVGDLRRTDVAGARNVGMISVRLSASHDDATSLPDADHVVDSHASLWELLGIG
jgi:putative hydrolase of the HAD superfamily